MTCPASTLSEQDLLKFAGVHVHNDVHWFVRAMTNYENHFDKLGKLPRNTIVAYLDSALLHGRALFEFFGHTSGNKKDNPVRACHYRTRTCPDSRSHLDREWKPAMNKYLMHLTSDRDLQVKRPLDDVGGKEHWRLPELWSHLESEFGQLAQGCSSADAKAFFEDLISVQVPAWEAQS